MYSTPGRPNVRGLGTPEKQRGFTGAKLAPLQRLGPGLNKPALLGLNLDKTPSFAPPKTDGAGPLWPGWGVLHFKTWLQIFAYTKWVGATVGSGLACEVCMEAITHERNSIMNTFDPMSKDRLATQLHLVDAAQKALQNASLTLQAARDEGDEPASQDGLHEALCATPDDPFAPLIAVLAEYSSLEGPDRVRRPLDAITTSFEANGALSFLHIRSV